MGRTAIIPLERIERTIVFVRGHRVMLSPDLATLYGVQAKALIQAVKRNAARFPRDFMFQLTRVEYRNLKSQIVTLGRSPRATPYAFTEHGVAMLSSVLHSRRAIAVNIEIVRVFVRLRKLLTTHADLARRLDELEHKYDGQFAAVFEAIRAIMDDSGEESNNPKIGYETESKGR
jgi:hypothetical protein